jgi:hypothetical protein
MTAEGSVEAHLRTVLVFSAHPIDISFQQLVQHVQKASVIDPLRNKQENACKYKCHLQLTNENGSRPLCHGIK